MRRTLLCVCWDAVLLWLVTGESLACRFGGAQGACQLLLGVVSCRSIVQANLWEDERLLFLIWKIAASNKQQAL